MKGVELIGGHLTSQGTTGGSNSELEERRELYRGTENG